jgi:hypothetical protein
MENILEPFAATLPVSLPINIPPSSGFPSQNSTTAFCAFTPPIFVTFTVILSCSPKLGLLLLNLICVELIKRSGWLM